MVENKKNPKADLTKTTGLFLNVGLVISLLLVIFAFEKKVYDEGSLVNLAAQAEDFEDLMDIPQTQQPPPPPPKVFKFEDTQAEEVPKKAPSKIMNSEMNPRKEVNILKRN